MVADAYRTFSGEVATSPYEEGLAYDSQLDQQRAQAALGWRMTVGLEGRTIRLRAIDENGKPLAGLRFTARLERPATEQGRQPVVFREVAPGVYEAAAGALSGAWDIRVSAFDTDRHRFDAERRLIAP
jgi:nitrogen fixation protein FixH